MSDADKNTVIEKTMLDQVRRKGKHKLSRKSAAAHDHVNNPNAQAPPRVEQYLAVTEQALRGHREIERGDGKVITFRDGAYATNDSAEAAFLAQQPGVVVEHRKEHGERRGRSFAVPALPWKEKPA